MNAEKTQPLIEVLKKEFESRKRRNHSYSLRAFSRFLDVDPSNLSKIMSYQVTPGERLKKKLAQKIGIETEIPFEDLSYRKTEDDHYSSHAIDIFNIISDWQNYAFLELLRIEKYQKQPDLKAMAKDLKTDESELQTLIQRLLKVGLIKKTAEGHFETADDTSSSTLHRGTSQAHREHQRQILEGAITAMDEVPLELRSQSSMTAAISRRKIPQAIEMIKEFRRSLTWFLSDCNDVDDVYHLSISLYPATDIYKQGEK